MKGICHESTSPNRLCETRKASRYYCSRGSSTAGPRPYHSSSLTRAPYPARYVTHRSQTLPLIISNQGSLPSKVCHTRSSQTLPLIISNEGSLPSKVCHTHSSQTLPLIISNQGSLPSKVCHTHVPDPTTHHL